MEIFWYIVIAVVVIVFFILDGYDFGVGIIHLFFAKKENDKLVIAKSAGLFWDANEVWLVAGGGMLFLAFPTYYASVFSGLYLPIMMILWLIIFRAIGLELRSSLNYSMWKDVWDKSFGIASLLLALFFGIALGNIVRGVNLGGVENGISIYEAHYFFLPLWNSTFSPTSADIGVIDWFTIIIGLISVIILTIHGANWIILKTNSSINNKLKSVIFNLNIVLSIFTIFSLFIWHLINPTPFENFLDKPFLLIFPLTYLVGLTGLFFVKKYKNETYGIILSSLVIAGGISSTLASMFPVILGSTNDINPPLTIYSMAADSYSLSIGFNWVIIGIVLIIVYSVIQRKLLKGKIDNMDYGEH